MRALFCVEKNVPRSGMSLRKGTPVLSSVPLQTTPLPWLLGLLASSVGLPFFAVSATAPLLQTWLANTRHRRANSMWDEVRVINLLVSGSVEEYYAARTALKQQLGQAVRECQAVQFLSGEQAISTNFRHNEQIRISPVFLID